MDTARNGGNPDDELTHLWARAQQLEHALESRVVIEQAKGILAARLDLPVDQTFTLLRRSACSHRLSLRHLAAEVVESDDVPPKVSCMLIGREVERELGHAILGRASRRR